MSKVDLTRKRTGERFGAAHLIDIVRGARTEKAVRFGHHRLPTFGVGADRSANGWRSVVRQMVAAGYLRIDIAGYGELGITDKGRELLRGEGAFLCREDTVTARGPARESRARRTGPEERPAHGEEAALLAALKALRLPTVRCSRTLRLHRSNVLGANSSAPQNLLRVWPLLSKRAINSCHSPALRRP